MTRHLSHDARADIKWSGLTIAAYIRHWGSDTWGGDTCGCPDSRCSGYHHAEHEPCGCLPVCIGLARDAQS